MNGDKRAIKEALEAHYEGGRTVSVLSWDDLPPGLRLGQPNNGCGKENASYLAVIDADGAVSECYSDAAEPEDKTLLRDLSWAVQLAERAVKAEDALAWAKRNGFVP